MDRAEQDVDVVVVGAGIAGLLAAAHLGQVGLDTVVLERHADPGGRLATAAHTTSDGDAVFDVGAQFFTAKHERFRCRVDRWVEQGVACVWFHGPPDPDVPVASPAASEARSGAPPPEAPSGAPAVPSGAAGEARSDAPPPKDRDGHPRYRGARGMRSLVDDVAAGLPAGVTVRTATPVQALAAAGRGWRVATRGAGRWGARAVVVTAPAPQALRLADTADVPLDPSASRRLGEVTYAPCIAVLATLDEPVDVGNEGALRVGGEPVEWIGDNHAKGISDVPAVTVHAGPAASRQWWDEHDPVVAALVLGGARRWLGQEGRALAVRRWRHSKPDRAAGRHPAEVLADEPLLVVAGDALSGGRVEGAAVSGLAAADLVAERLR